MKINDAIIGNTGFVGGNLLRQHGFSATYNSTTIDQSAGTSVDTLVCAAAPGSMVEANADPDRDAARINALCRSLSQINAKRFVLISSIAVFLDFAGQDDEGSTAYQTKLAYGRNRRQLEVFCQAHFTDCLILRLPALYGSGLKKNFLFDLLNPAPTLLNTDKMQHLSDALPGSEAEQIRQFYTLDTESGFYRIDRTAFNTSAHRAGMETALAACDTTALQFTHKDTRFQYYGLDRLWADINRAFEAGLGLLNLATEPLCAADIYRAVTGDEMPNTQARLHREDMQTRHAGLWGQSGPYIEPSRDVLRRVTDFYAREKAAL
ncbi:hypothetical protein ROLI_046020 (plasmid) [Roseobacter fucihabitans]|uniref:NAD-dependent epimerase/dehydratase domain-containing protein n=1 Tax=Roseobacter fucihabitans TaxID=1537242 RepID=A0ABZ2BZF7_9RHOB|nr:NAD-dependent epimerase/dehydratase family protein [Roseobacter litoralis]MBC6966890.1 hypothetical protein [Roseobacter litoralis]